MFAKANEEDDDFIQGEAAPEAFEGERRGMYRCYQTNVTIASGGHDDPPYIVVMPDGTVHDAGLTDDEYLDIGTVNELLDEYGAQVN